MRLTAIGPKTIKKLGLDITNVTTGARFKAHWNDSTEILLLYPADSADTQTGNVIKQKDGYSLVTTPPLPYQGVYRCSTQRFHNWSKLLRAMPSAPDTFGRPTVAELQIIAESIPMVLGPRPDTFIAPASYQIKQGDVLLMNDEHWLVNSVINDTGLSLLAMTKQQATGK